MSRRPRRPRERCRLGRRRSRFVERALPDALTGLDRGERDFPSISPRARGLRSQSHRGDRPFPRTPMRRRSAGPRSPAREVDGHYGERDFPSISPRARGLRSQSHRGDRPFPRIPVRRRSAGPRAPAREVDGHCGERDFPGMPMAASAAPWRARREERSCRSTGPPPRHRDAPGGPRSIGERSFSPRLADHFAK